MKVVLALVLAALVGFPQGVSAQAGEEGATSEPGLEEPAPSSEPAPEEPALQLKLDSAGVDVAPSPPRTADGYTLEEMDGACAASGVRDRRLRCCFHCWWDTRGDRSWWVTAGGEEVPKERSATGVRTPARLWRRAAPSG